MDNDINQKILEELQKLRKTIQWTSAISVLALVAVTVVLAVVLRYWAPTITIHLVSDEGESRVVHKWYWPGSLRKRDGMASELCNGVAKPGAWKKNYNPGSRDTFQYALALRLGKGKEEQAYQTGWDRGAEARLPKDLRNLFEAVNKAWRRADSTARR